MTGKDPKAGESQGHQLTKGVSILGFHAESRARKAGMRKGEVIIEYDNVRNLTTSRLGELTAVIRPQGARTRVVFVRDGQKLSVTLSPGPLGISAMDTAPQLSSELRAANDEIARTVQWLQRAYLAFAILVLLDTLSLLLRSSGFWSVGEALLFVTLYAAAYFGLRYRMDEAISFVLILSAFKCVSLFFHIISPAEDVKELIAKVLLFLGLLFFAYQIRFFRRADVRQLFGDKGMLVF